MGLFSSIGNIFNDLTGASSAAKYNTQVNKEFAKNAHQWEVEDLKKAGLNPMLSAGGSTAGSIAGKSGNMTQANTGISDIMNSASGIAKTISDMDLNKSQEKVNDANIGKTAAETQGITENNKYIPQEKKSQIAVNTTAATLNSAKAQNAKAEKDLIQAEAELKRTENAVKKGGKAAELLGTDPMSNVANSAKSMNKFTDYLTGLFGGII